MPTKRSNSSAGTRRRRSTPQNSSRKGSAISRVKGAMGAVRGSLSTAKRGFAALSAQKRREIAAKGGRSRKAA